MAQASATSWDSFTKGLENYRKTIGRNKSTVLSSIAAKDEGRKLVQLYFRDTRSELTALGCKENDIKNLDSEIQNLLRLLNGNNRTTSYKTCVKSVRAIVQEIEFVREILLGSIKSTEKSSVLNPSNVEAIIIVTLQKLLPSAALSYEQALIDLKSNVRISFRGTATELRETLREVLDHLAPDKEVMKAQDFKLEPNQTKPTQKQKVRYILRTRGLSKSATKTPEDAVLLAEGLTGSLARSTYDRGSISVHIGTSKTEVQKIKMYVESVLAELLEIHAQVGS